MALNVVTTGANRALENLVNKTAPDNLVIRLYKNNVTITNASVVGDFTVADFTGYASTGTAGAVTLTGASWGAASGGSIAYAEQTWTSSAGSQSSPVYGYYITNAAGTTLIYAEAFAGAPYTIVNNGDAIKVTPTITAD